MRNRAALLVWALIVAGCGGRDRTLHLEQQKLTLDLMEAQNEQLAALMQKENDLRALEKENQETLQEIKRQRAALQGREQEMVQKERAIQDTIAKEETRRKAEEDQLEAERKRVSADHLKNQQAAQQIATKLARLEQQLSAIERQQEAERLAKEAERRAEEERQRPEVMERMQRRQPALEQLAITISGGISGYVVSNRNLSRSTMRNGLLNKFREKRVAEIEDEDAFVIKAQEIVVSYCMGVGVKDLAPDPRLSKLNLKLDTTPWGLAEKWGRNYLMKVASSPK